MLKLTLKQNSGSQFDVQIKEAGSTVLDLKQACAEKAGITAEEMRLIYKGKILKDDNSLVEYKINDGDTVHLVKSKAAGASSTAPTQAAEVTSTTASSGTASTASTGAAGVDPMAAFGGLGGMGGLGGLGGMGGLGGLGAGLPNMASGGGLNGLGGLGGMDPNMIS